MIKYIFILGTKYGRLLTVTFLKSLGILKPPPCHVPLPGSSLQDLAAVQYSQAKVLNHTTCVAIKILTSQIDGLMQHHMM